MIEGRFQDLATHVVEIQVDPGGTESREPLGHILILVIDGPMAA